MTISCTNTAKENCEHRRAGLCFNPCVLNAAQSATEMARADAAEGEVERIAHLDFRGAGKMNYTEIEGIRDDAIRMRIIGCTLLAYMPIDVLAHSYNGTGPEFLPQKIRDRLDAVCRPFLPAVMIHDVDYTLSDGSRRSFRYANLRLFLNCIICVNNAYPWFNWRRYALYAQSWAMYRAVSNPKFGWIAWIQAYNKTKGKTNE